MNIGLWGEVKVIYNWIVNEIWLSLHSINKYSLKFKFSSIFSNSACGGVGGDIFIRKNNINNTVRLQNTRLEMLRKTAKEKSSIRLSSFLIRRVKECFRIRFEFLIKTPPCASHPGVCDYVVCIPPRNQTSRCASYSGVWLHGVHTTAQSDFEKCIISWSLFLRSVHTMHRAIRLRGVHLIAESDTNFNWHKGFY